MMVKFKKNAEPCIVYRVINDTPVMEFAEAIGRYCAHIELEVLGLVPIQLLTDAIDHPNNIPAIDVAVQLSK